MISTPKSNGADRLKVLMAEPYQVLLVPRPEGVIAQVVMLGLVAEGRTESEALAALHGEKVRFFERYIASGEQVVLPLPAEQPAIAPQLTKPNFATVAVSSLVATATVLATLVVLLVAAIPVLDAVGAKAIERARESLIYYVASRQRAWDALTPEERSQAIACVSGLKRDGKFLSDALALLIVVPTCGPASRSGEEQPVQR